MENNGQFEWQPPASVPHRLYVRVEAVDTCGNVGIAQTANPLKFEPAVAMLTPTAPAEVLRRPPPAMPGRDPNRPTAAILGVERNGN